VTATTLTQHEARAHALAGKLIEFLETSEVPDGLFAAGMFCDFTMPTWRLQASGVEDSVALRLAGHPGQGTVPRWRFDPDADRVRPRSGGGMGLGRRALDLS
jgi:hypothetical protein